MDFSKHKSSKTSAPTQQQAPCLNDSFDAYTENKNRRVEVLLRIPGCTVRLTDEGETLELTKGEFVILRIFDMDVPLATIVKVGDDLQWPLTKDVPVVKLDSFHYLFSLLVKDGNPLHYGVTFNGSTSRGSLDSFLKEHSCFSGAASTGDRHVDWREYAPRIEDYNNILAKAIARGTGEIVKGIFKCTDAYIKKVREGGEIILTQAPGGKGRNGYNNTRKSTDVNKILKRVRNVSERTDKISKSLLDKVGVARGTGMAVLSKVPREVRLASLDAIHKVLHATSTAVTRAMTERFGERAGETTEDVLATVRHITSAAENMVKMRKTIKTAAK